MVVPTRLLRPLTLLERLVPYTMRVGWGYDVSAVAWVAGLRR